MCQVLFKYLQAFTQGNEEEYLSSLCVCLLSLLLSLSLLCEWLGGKGVRQVLLDPLCPKIELTKVNTIRLTIDLTVCVC